MVPGEVLVSDLSHLVYRGVMPWQRSKAQESSQQAQLLVRENEMTSNRQDAPASFTIYAESDEESTRDAKAPRPSMTIIWVCLAITGAVIAVIAIALVLTIGGLMHADNVNAGQAAQIRSLNQANARLMTEQSEMNAALNGQNPAADTNLVTCADLRKMGLTIATGGSVSSVPGTVSLSQNPVRIPAHCAGR